MTAAIDLNLLRVFEALMELRSVTRVADRLGLTQSAVSHALGRLRRALDDPLFVRGPGGLQPSPRAEQIAPSVSASLQQLRDVLAPARFVPAKADRSFTIATGAYFCTLILPALLERVRREAPNVRLRVVPLIDNGTSMLDRGQIDLALGAERELPRRFVVDPLFSDEMVWIAARTNPLVQRNPDLDEIMRHPRVKIAITPNFLASPLHDHDVALPVDQFTDDHAAAAEATPAIVYDSQTAAAIVARTDSIACVARRIAEREQRREEIAILMPAAHLQSVGLAMIWHERNRSDLAFAWLRDLVLAVAVGDG